MSDGGYGRYDNGYFVPPMPAAPPPPPADGARAVAVAVLNLSGLGLGYALTRRWALTALCWIATAVLLTAALPADPDGVPEAALVAYAVFLVLAAAHGARVGLRTPLALPGRAPLALALGLLLLAVPAGGVVWYDAERDEAVQQMLLDRLEEADRLVAAAGKKEFTAAEADYREALTAYEDLVADHPDSRAAARVPGRMKTYYATVGAPYEQREYCTAIAPLTYLRTVPDRVKKTELGELEKWPDDRLATSLYECASAGLAADQSTWAAQFGELLTTFPKSAPAAKVEPAVNAAVVREEKGLRGADPCTAVQRLRALATRITELPGEKAGIHAALAKDAGRATAQVASGTYTCGVDQYRDGDFDAALTTMNEYVTANRTAENVPLAKKIAIAAEVAQTVPEAGKKLPTMRSGGSISVTVKNDSPDAVTVLFTGPVTGSLTLKACGGCRAYSLGSTVSPYFKPCEGGKNYPQRTISLPPGTTYFVHKSNGSSISSSTPASDTAKLENGYVYTECAYTTESFGSGL
ncbi:MerC domain-containing protein [Streptomyces sp. NPDC088254]|uniref:MerC domain-containing protein n=1 Tax=Streptomyces sp. NPDC088254 TaxID=3365847 RepID=UPI0038155FDD